MRVRRAVLEADSADSGVTVLILMYKVMSRRCLWLAEILYGGIVVVQSVCRVRAAAWRHNVGRSSWDGVKFGERFVGRVDRVSRSC